MNIVAHCGQVYCPVTQPRKNRIKIWTWISLMPEHPFLLLGLCCPEALLFLPPTDWIYIMFPPAWVLPWWSTLSPKVKAYPSLHPLHRSRSPHNPSSKLPLSTFHSPASQYHHLLRNLPDAVHLPIFLFGLSFIHAFNWHSICLFISAICSALEYEDIGPAPRCPQPAGRKVYYW